MATAPRDPRAGAPASMGEPGQRSTCGTTCDFCAAPVLDGTYVDGKTTLGPWATMCERCFPRYGVGLGLGRGQRFDVATGEKVAG